MTKPFFSKSLPWFNYPADKEKISEKIFTSGKNEFKVIDEQVANIIREVKSGGVDSLIKLEKKFDGVNLSREMIRVSNHERDIVDKADIPVQFKNAVAQAIKNIRAFHNIQKPTNLSYTGEYGEKLVQQFNAIEKVGVYVPGGKGGMTPLVSTLMMNVIPAQIAGCSRIVAMTPPRIDGTINPLLLYVFKELKVEEIYKVGGAQAVASLAYGVRDTESKNMFILPVDIIVGPGNQYVLSAKKQVFGDVMIDGLFGHSEIVVVSDGTVDPCHIAGDMLSQAEHAGGELVVLIADNKEHVKAVLKAIDELIPTLDRSDLIIKSLRERGCVVLVEDGVLQSGSNHQKDIESVAELVNFIAPEHLELLVEDYQLLLKEIKHTGAIFIGGYASEPIGDYICGTNHVLPTGGAAKFSSPLGVYTFLKRTNIIEYNQTSFNAYAKHAEVLAQAEGLTAHKKAITLRTEYK